MTQTAPLIGELLKLHRRIYNIGSREFAKQIGLSHATVCRVENGENMDGKTMFKLFNILFRGSA